MKRRVSPPPPTFYSVFTLSVLLLAACSQQPAKPDFDILSQGKPVSLLMTQGLTAHRRLEGGLSIQSLEQLHLKTVEAVDPKGVPFVNITFTAPQPIDELWTFAKGLTGNEWSTSESETPWTTTITGATTVRDVLVTSSEGLSLLMEMSKTVEAMGGAQNLKEVVAYESQNFVMRDMQGQLWNLSEQRLLTLEETQKMTDVYNEIYQGNNTPQAAQTYETMWDETLSESEIQAQTFSYELGDFATKENTLDVKKLAKAIGNAQPTSEISSQGFSQNTTRCFLFFCSVYQKGHIGGSVSSSYGYGGLQASQGGFDQYPSQYKLSGSGFNYPVCFTGAQVTNQPLGCGPSALIGLLGRKFNDGYTFFGYNKSSTSLTALNQYLIQGVGTKGRARVAEYLGTCFFIKGGTTTGITFLNGANDFLRDAQRGTNGILRMKGNVSHLAGNVWSARAKADILVREMGVENNPVVAEYFLPDGQGHFAPVAEFLVRRDSGFTQVDIRTIDHQYTGSWYSLSIGWGTERGVFYID